MKITEKERLATLGIIRLCYILVTLSALYSLKIFLHPEGAYEMFVAPYQTGIYLENIFWSFAITAAGNSLVERLI